MISESSGLCNHVCDIIVDFMNSQIEIGILVEFRLTFRKTFFLIPLEEPGICHGLSREKHLGYLIHSGDDSALLWILILLKLTCFIHNVEFLLTVGCVHVMFLLLGLFELLLNYF